MIDPKYVIYEDGVISIGLHAKNADGDVRDLLQLAMKWLPPKPSKKKDGTVIETTNVMGGETDWFLLPHTLGAAVGCKLVEQKTAGLYGFQETGFEKMVKWLVEMEHLDDAMCY